MKYPARRPGLARSRNHPYDFVGVQVLTSWAGLNRLARGGDLWRFAENQKRNSHRDRR
jgi:hypothetical protein